MANAMQLSSISSQVVTGVFTIMSALAVFISTQVADSKKDRRTQSREREARDATRKDKRWEIHNTFQRQTLLDLQEATMNFMQNVGAAHLIELNARYHNLKMHETKWPDELNLSYQVQAAKTSILGVRVHDDDVRTLLQQFRESSKAALFSRGVTELQAGLRNAESSFASFNERVGVVLRALDDEQL